MFGEEGKLDFVAGDIQKCRVRKEELTEEGVI